MSGGGGGGQGGAHADNSLAPLWITLLIFATLALLWYLFHAQIVDIIFQLKLLEAKVISLFTSAIAQDITIMKNAVPADVSFKELASMTTAIGNYVRYPVTTILVILGGILYFHNPSLRFKKTHTMKSLLESEQNNWPNNLKPITKLDLLKEDIDKGPWAMAMTPMQFAKKYDLLQLEPTIITENTLLRKTQPTVSINKGKTKKLFTLQLGDYWQGPEALHDHTKALFAICAARMNHERDAPNKLLLQIANSVTSNKLDFSGTYALLNKYKNSQVVQNITQKHAYTLTIMASMLEKARSDGVLATAEFLWLKPLDRPLWFMLNTVGRQTSFVETSGAYAHWLAEKELGRKIMVPMVDEAVDALEIAIKEVTYTPEENEGGAQ